MFQDFLTTHHRLAVVVPGFFEEDVKSDGSSEQRSYIAGPHGTVAVHTVNAASPGGSLTYWHRDHLGSLTVTTNQSGAVVDRMRYDPWG